MPAKKKSAVPKQLFAVAWVPEYCRALSTQDEVLNAGGRIIDKNLSKSGAEEVERCLRVGTTGLDGEYITIQ